MVPVLSPRSRATNSQMIDRPWRKPGPDLRFWGFWAERLPKLTEAVPFGAASRDRVCKPGSVLTAIYLVPPLPAGSSHLLGTAGPASCPTHGVAPDRVYSGPMSPWAGCALTAPFHPYRVGTSFVSLASPQKRQSLLISLLLLSPPELRSGGAPIWEMRNKLRITRFAAEAAKLIRSAVPPFPTGT